jgi:hypothetical protein
MWNRTPKARNIQLCSQNNHTGPLWVELDRTSHFLRRNMLRSVHSLKLLRGARCIKSIFASVKYWPSTWTSSRRTHLRESNPNTTPNSNRQHPLLFWWSNLLWGFQHQTGWIREVIRESCLYKGRDKKAEFWLRFLLVSQTVSKRRFLMNRFR